MTDTFVFVSVDDGSLTGIFIPDDRELHTQDGISA
jgi:hypothetical protein